MLSRGKLEANFLSGEGAGHFQKENPDGGRASRISKKSVLLNAPVLSVEWAELELNHHCRHDPQSPGRFDNRRKIPGSSF